MKTKILPAIAVVFALIFVVGCARESVPVSTLKGTFAGQPYDWSLPKDSDIGSLIIEAGTNGTARLELKEFRARMNPAVIQSSAEGMALVIKQAFESGGSAAKQAAAGVATGGASEVLK